jgi:hypothetical protein
MRARFIFGVLVICFGIGSTLTGAPGARQTATREGHIVWVAEALKRMETIGRPGRDGNGRVALVEDERDRIVTISRPYLQFSIVD